MASRAIADSIQELDPNVEVKTVDCIEQASFFFRALYVWPYWLMIRYAPSLWARLFRARQEQFHRQTAPPWLFRLGCARVFQKIRDWKPDLVVATEVGACEIASLARQANLTLAPVIAVATDHESEPVWLKEEVDQYFVPTREVSSQLERWGVTPEKIVVSGIPVASKFHRQETSSDSKKVLGIPSDRPMVLVMGGGMGPLKMDDIVLRLAAMPGPMTVLAVTGMNAKMKHRLEALCVEFPPEKSLRVHGWTDQIDVMMRAADVLVTKPGGLTLTEAACVGLPMICVNPIPGPEETHCRLIEREGLGVVAKTLDDIPARVREFVARPMARLCPVWLKQDAAGLIARILLERSKTALEESQDPFTAPSFSILPMELQEE
jgi:processive 1,2-diacylglycerol beta-glucosyltransferase